MSSLFSNRFKAVLVAGVAAAALSGGYFYTHLATAQAQPVAAKAQSVPVGVATIEPKDVQIWSNYSGRLHAVDSAAIRPEVSGRIVDLRFADGQAVKAGDILLVIDPRPFEAALAKAKADLAQARSNASLAQANARRAADLVKSDWIAHQVYDERMSAQKVAEAAIQGAEAEVRRAEIDLDHAYVKAPIPGRVSRAEVTVGNLVEAGLSAPLLTTIVSNDAVYADFEVDEQTYLSAVRNRARNADSEQKIPVELSLGGGSEYGYRGTIESFDNRIDTASGTIRARARFVNSDGGLVPGMFVGVRLAANVKGKTLLVPDRAVGNDQDKKFVYVVGPGEKAAYREVNLGPHVGGSRVVVSGLEPGDRVIVDGLQHVRPDVAVDATVIKAASL